jgi:hypothetical protein
MSLENVAPLINPKTDFASIKGKIEPTRDLILKLIDPFSLSFDTDLVKEEKSEGITYYTFKAKVTGPDGRTVTGWGKCGTDEVNGERAEHDALTKAETRSLKRAIEAKAGFGMVNQLILRFFGGFEEKGPRDVTPVEAVKKVFLEPNGKLVDHGAPDNEFWNIKKKTGWDSAKKYLNGQFGVARDWKVEKRDDGWHALAIDPEPPAGAGVEDGSIHF